MFQYPDYLIAGSLATALSAGLTLLVRRLAKRWNIVDRASSAPDRKTQDRAVPLLGGLAVFGAFTIVVLGYVAGSTLLVGDSLPLKYIVGVLIGGAILMTGGALDDRFRLPARRQLLFPIVAAVAILVSGIGISSITNPLGGSIALDGIRLPLFHWNDAPYFLVLPGDLLVLVWLLGMMYTTKLLDGLDGLVSGISVIGSLIIFLVSLRPEVLQPGTAMLAAIFAGSCLGFLLFNWHPASMYLGEGGSLFVGFMLGVLSIISGGKIATALLILGIPILDVAWVIIRRAVVERRSPFTVSDRKHLHFRFLAFGFSHRGTVIVYWALSAIFGMTTLVVSGKEKVYALLALTGVTLLLALILARRRRLSDDLSRTP